MEGSAEGSKGGAESSKIRQGQDPNLSIIRTDTPMCSNVLKRVVKGIPAKRILVLLTHPDGACDIKAVTIAQILLCPPCPSGETHSRRQSTKYFSAPRFAASPEPGKDMVWRLDCARGCWSPWIEALHGRLFAQHISKSGGNGHTETRGSQSRIGKGSATLLYPRNGRLPCLKAIYFHPAVKRCLGRRLTRRNILSARMDLLRIKSSTTELRTTAYHYPIPTQ